MVPILEIHLRRRSRGHAGRCRDVNDAALFLIFLQRFQDSRSLCRDDLQNDHGRFTAVRLHLLSIRDGIFSR